MSLVPGRSDGRGGLLSSLGVGRLAALVLAGCAPATAGRVVEEPAPAPAPVPAVVEASLVFDGVTVVDVEQGALLPAQRVAIAGNRIQAVGPADRLRVSPDARIVEARGKYLIPGLWDLHTHPRRKAALFYPLFIAHGVTGVRDGWSEVPLDTVVQRWREIVAGTRVGPPRQLLSGPPHPRTYEAMTANKAAGANFIKVYPFSFAKAAAAGRAGMPFGGHVNSSTPAVEASDSGVVIIDHINTSGGLNKLCWGEAGSVETCQPVAERLRQNGTWLVPTLARFANHGMYIKDTRSTPIFARFREQVKQFWADSAPARGNWLHTPETTLPPADSTVDLSRRMSIMQQVGLPILAGTDAGAPVLRPMPPGFALHVELAMYVAEGLTPLNALQSATLNPAKMLHGTDSLGTVAPGKLADLVLLDANPLADITNTTTIRAVVANGRYFDRLALDSLLAEVRAKGP